MPQPVKMILDTDPGIDDAMALYFAAASEEVDLLGLTTVFGNVTTPEATRNALFLLENLGLEVPVAEGADAPLSSPAPYPPRHIHGDAGLGALPAPVPSTSALGESAAMFLTRMAAEHPGEITLCAVGPLTNVATALRMDPALAQNLRQIVVMGGAVDSAGNISAYAEANIYHDAQAAAEVFASGARIVMVGLDVTHSVVMSGAEFSTLARKSTVAGAFLQQISQFYLEVYTQRGKFDGCAMHDPTAVIACTHPELFDLVETPVRVETEGERIGQTTADPYAESPPVAVAKGVDARAVKQVFEAAIARLA